MILVLLSTCLVWLFENTSKSVIYRSKAELANPMDLFWTCAVKAILVNNRSISSPDNFLVLNERKADFGDEIDNRCILVGGTGIFTIQLTKSHHTA